MPNRRKSYADMERYRTTTLAQKLRYYGKTAGYESRSWIAEEDCLVLEHSITDTELSHKIERSVAAIQIRRCRLKKNIR